MIQSTSVGLQQLGCNNESQLRVDRAPDQAGHSLYRHINDSEVPAKALIRADNRRHEDNDRQLVFFKFVCLKPLIIHHANC